MKQRFLSIKVYENETVLFEKSPATPQDIPAALSLFERDSLRIEINIGVMDVSTGTKNQD